MRVHLTTEYHNMWEKLIEFQREIDEPPIMVETQPPIRNGQRSSRQKISKGHS